MKNTTRLDSAKLQDSEKASSALSKKTVASRERAQQTALLCAHAAIDKKALHTVILDVSTRSGFTDCFVITSGSSEKQVQAMADEVLARARAQGEKPRLEGYDEGRWILVDLGDVVVHLFHEAIRDFYKLEELWMGTPRVTIPQEYYTGSTAAQIAATHT